MFSKKVKKAANEYGKKNGYKVSQNENTIDLEKGDEMIELDGELMHYDCVNRRYIETRGDEDIIEMGKIDNSTIEVVFEDETKKEFPVIKLASRNEAIEKCKEVTKLALNADNAFEILHTLCNDFEKHRNYEIEMYLDRLTNKYYRIDELCPFNGFKWFD